jgi:3-mercaptopyruvate sulfurtransferase SseA
MKLIRSLAPYLMALALGALLAAAAGCSDSSTTPKVEGGYPNAELLVGGADLEAALDDAGAPILIDTRSAAAYAAGHVPGAINIPISPGNGTFDKGGAGPEATDLKAAPDLAAALGGFGLTREADIVVYGTDLDWLVGRMFWMLEYLGATNVAMLDGGYAKWTADGRPTVTDAATRTAATFTPQVVPDILVDKADVLAAYANTSAYAIVDSRNAVDYQASRIPNAINILIPDFLNPDFTLKSALEIDDLLESKEITRDRIVYTHCYVGYRSSQEYFIFRLMGYTVAHYDGSWADWNADPETPKAP